MATYDYTQYSGYCYVENMEKTEHTCTIGGVDYPFYRYSFDIPFVPTKNPVYENITFQDVHGNEYSTAENVICMKLDFGYFYLTGKSIPSISSAAQGGTSFGLASGKVNMVFDNYTHPLYQVEKDPFKEFTFEPLENGTDGFLPTDILKPASLKFAPLPADFYAIAANGVVTLNTINSVTSTVELKWLLSKLNTPLYFAVGGGTQTVLARVILYAKKFTDING